MILAIVEHAAGRPDRLSLEALVLARRLAGGGDGPVHAVLIGVGARAAAAELAGQGVAVAHVAEDPRLEAFAPAAWAAAVEAVVASTAPTVVLAPGSDRATEVLAHLAARTGFPMAANVVDIAAGAGAAGPLRLTRQRWAGSLLEDAVLDAPIKLLSVAGHAFEPEAVGGAAAPAIEAVAPALTDADLRVHVTGRVPAEAGSISLADAKIVVGGGRGLGSGEAFAMLDELAGLIGAAVGVSRVATSAGWRPHAQQIGQTGQRIAPDLYIACGISGAIQHIVGCKAAKQILVINSDPEAPILSRASYAVIGDLHAIVPAISAEVRRVRAAGQG
ncbi:MAG TPA: electron transfer flavoprotein subunit alpha/FixB family protein [Candidatus Limnocylindrales bacterium]